MAYGFLALTSTGRTQIDENHPVMVWNQWGVVTCSAQNSGGTGANWAAPTAPTYSPFVSGRHMATTLVFARPYVAPTSGNSLTFSGSTQRHPTGQSYVFQSPTQNAQIEYVFLSLSTYTTSAYITPGSYGMRIWGPLGGLIFDSNMIPMYTRDVASITPQNGTIFSYFGASPASWNSSAPFALMNGSYGYQHIGAEPNSYLYGTGINCYYYSSGNYRYQTWPYQFQYSPEDQPHTYDLSARTFATASYPGYTGT